MNEEGEAMNTIEVERKFNLTPEICSVILGLNPVAVTDLPRTDTYYDSADYELTTRGWWLRKRNGNWELKCALKGKSKTAARHEEVEDAQEILQRLEIKSEVLNDDVLEKHGFTPFVTLSTERTTVRVGKFRIDMDVCSALGTSFRYEVGELELMVSRNHVAQAEKEIADFAREKLGIPEESVEGKLVRFIRLHRPEHYYALVSADIVRKERLV